MRRTSRHPRSRPAPRQDGTNKCVLAAAALASLVIGHSAEGREITATRVGEADAPVKVLVVGDVHGNEPAGEAIVARLRSAKRRRRRVLPRAHGQPGRPRRGTRQNARGVDLNRNFPLPLGDAARAARTTRAAGRLGAGDEGDHAARAPRAAAARDLLPPAPGDHRPRPRRRRGAAARLRAPHRAAAALAAELPRHRDRLAEPPDRGRDGVRRRAEGRAGAGAAARRRGARARPEALDEDRPRPPRRDRVERRGQAHVVHRPAADRARPRRRRAGCASGSRGASSRWSCARRGHARGRPPSWRASTPRVDPDLAELDYGPYEGRTTTEIRVEQPGLDASGSDPGGETLAAGRRARRPRDRPRAGGRRRRRAVRPRPHPAHPRRALDRAAAGVRRAASRWHRGGLRARLRARDPRHRSAGTHKVCTMRG